MKTVAAKIVEMLEAAGVTHIHGVVGDSLNGITEHIRTSSKIKWLHYRHEEAAAFAAGAEARFTGRLAVCAGSCGPGNMHLINGLYDAHRSEVPVLAIAAHIPSEQIGTGYFQETRPESLFRECSHFCETINHPAQTEPLMRIAMQTAVGEGGVSVISISGDIALKTLESDVHSGVYFPRPLITPRPEDITALAKLINEAKKVTLFCGAGCVNAHDEVLQLAEKIKSPIVHALGGKEYIQYDNPYDVGMTGLIGNAAGNAALHHSHLMVMLGTDFPYKEWYPSDVKIVQIDWRVKKLGRRCKLDLGLVGSIKETLQLLAPHIQTKSDDSFLKKCQHAYASDRKALDAKAVANEHFIHPEYLTKVISEKAKDDAIFTADTGTPIVWAARYLAMKKGRRLMGSLRHGSMANAMPQAIGAQFAFPKRQVISLSGDGGFSMLMGDLLTIYQYNIPVKIFIFNNGLLGFVAMEMKVAGIPPFGTDFKNPNFAAMANAIGIKGIRIEKSSQVESGVEEALQHQGPVVVDTLVNPNELSMPPKISLAQAKGFSVYALKETQIGNFSEVWDTVKTNFLEK